MKNTNRTLKILCLSFVLASPLYSSSNKSWLRRSFALWAGFAIALDGASAESNSEAVNDACAGFRLLQDELQKPPIASSPFRPSERERITEATQKNLAECQERERILQAQAMLPSSARTQRAHKAIEDALTKQEREITRAHEKTQKAYDYWNKKRIGGRHNINDL